jgi:lipopolysaccharide export system permease protein
MVVSRYLIREFLGFLAPILVGFVLLYLLVDLFERLDILLKNKATLGAATRYFLFKTPLIVTQILPPAVIVSLVLSLGMLCRRNEIAALRASGISLLQTAVPLAAVALLISVAALIWNETVVPYSTRQYQTINLVEIRKRERRSLLSDHEIWYHGSDGFYNVKHLDPSRKTLFGVTIYRTDSAFALRSVVQIDWARWTDTGWVVGTAIEHEAGGNGRLESRVVEENGIALSERFDDFLEFQREPEELSYLALRERIAELTRKGIDASNYLVDLQLKLAIPFTSLVLACVAIPLAGRVRRHASLAAIVGSGAALGFGYWVLLGLTTSLGQSAVLPASIAAWAANIIFLLISAGLFLSAE